MREKALECIDELSEHIQDITNANYTKSDFQKGCIYGLKIAIQVISRIFKIER